MNTHRGGPVRVVALVGDHLRHRWYADRLARASDVELRGVVSERQPAQPRGATPVEDALVAEHFELRRLAEESHFGSAAAWDDLGAPLLAVERGETNSGAVASWVRQREPEYVLLFGCGILREPLLPRFASRAVNLHLGLSPYYRGHATNFWPLVNGEPECVGATVHLATAEVDAGPILRQARPRIGPDDSSHDIGCNAIVAGAEALLGSLPDYSRGKLEPVRPSPGGRVFRHADFDAAPGAAVAQLRRRFEEGMIPAYLARKDERDASYPIVE